MSAIYWQRLAGTSLCWQPLAGVGQWLEKQHMAEAVFQAFFSFKSKHYRKDLITEFVNKNT